MLNCKRPLQEVVKELKGRSFDEQVRKAFEILQKSPDDMMARFRDIQEISHALYPSQSDLEVRSEYLNALTLALARADMRRGKE